MPPGEGEDGEAEEEEGDDAYNSEADAFELEEPGAGAELVGGGGDTGRAGLLYSRGIPPAALDTANSATYDYAAGLGSPPSSHGDDGAEPPAQSAAATTAAVVQEGGAPSSFLYDSPLHAFEGGGAVTPELKPLPLAVGDRRPHSVRLLAVPTADAVGTVGAGAAVATAAAAVAAGGGWAQVAVGAAGGGGVPPPPPPGIAGSWGLPPSDVAAHKAAMLRFNLSHAPSEARLEHVDAAWALLGPRVWGAMLEQYPALRAAVESAAAGLAGSGFPPTPS